MMPKKKSARIISPPIRNKNALRTRALPPAADASGNEKPQVLADLVTINRALKNEIKIRKQAEARYRELIESAPDAIVTVDDRGRILLINSQTEKMFGYHRDELLLQPLEILVPERFRGVHIAHRDGYFFKPHTRPMGGGLELAGRRKNGNEFPIEISLSSVHTDNRILVTAVIRDITERRWMEKALREGEERFRTLVNSMDDIVFMLDLEQRYVGLFGRWLEKEGFSTEQFLGKTQREVLGPEAAAVHEAANRRALAGEPVIYEWSAESPNGSRYFQTSVSPIRDSKGGITGIVGVGREITEHRRAEETLRESEQRFRALAGEKDRQLILSERLISFGELTATLAHEFNNPLGIVIGFAQDLLTELDPSDPRRPSVKIIEEEARRCKKIMQDLLDFGRQTPPLFAQTDPADLVHKNIDLLSARFRKADIRTVIQSPAGLPRIWADAQQIGQVLVNLFFNAMEAMPNGGALTVTVAQTPVRPPDLHPENPNALREVVIAVTDTGPGIDPDKLPRIFEPFFTTKSKKGMGLGLSICKSIMEAHGGRIAVESKLGEGTSIRLHLPIERRSHERDESVVSR